MGSSTANGSPGDHVSFEPIAIVGMACRLPGSITSPSGLWDALVNKTSVRTPTVPESRFNIDAFYHKNLNRPGSLNVRGGYFLDGSPHDFDPSFFGMTPVEAMWLDPQQRRILEVTYECLENADLRLEDVAGKDIGVFVGCFTSDYQQMLHREPDFRHEYAATGTDPGLLSARVCNIFDLRGPSAVINSACSSSMTAVHQACLALQTGECDAAIAGGVNLIISVDQHLNTAKLGILSPTSTCHTFDAAADGYGRAEGAGAIYLRRLSDAVRDGTPIRAVIRGSALNTNGKVKNQGITHPSLEGQERVLRAAYKRAGLDPTDTLYVECHGTGTPVGDPIEVKAISNGMNARRSREQPLLLGAIKANIGHSEAASGIFAVIKAALMVESGVIPGVAGLKTLNPALKEEEWNVKINVDTILWPKSPLTRRVGVSSFGYGGTNGHLILEAAQSDHGQARAQTGHESSSPSRALVCFTAHDRATLEKNIEAHACVVDNHHLQDVAYTLNCRRTHFTHRAFTIALENKEKPSFSKQSMEFGVAESSGPVAFVFTGQGAQWVGMGRDAMHTLSTFKMTIRSLDQYLRTLKPPVRWTIEEALLGNIDSEHIAEPDIAQPLCTAFQIAIVDQLRKWGITPSAVVGHSSGEIAAAYAAGMLSAQEAFVTSFYRGQAVAQECSAGSMLAVGVGMDRIEPYIRDTDVVIACENSPKSVTLSGSESSTAKLILQLEASEIFVRELKTGRPYHSPAMKAIAPLYEQLLREAYPEAGSSAPSERLSRVPMISSVTGRQVYENNMNSSGHITPRKTKLSVSRQCHQQVIKKLHQSTHADRWYKTFDRVGVFYGHTFQRLGEVNSNGRDYTAAGTIELDQESGSIDGESRYVLHPGTIDACFQLAIISFEKGRYNAMPYSTIPMRVEEITIASPEEAEGNGFAWTDEYQSPLFRSHIQLVSSNGLPILECKGVWFKEHEMSWSARSTAVIPDQKYMQYRWQPDIDYASKSLGKLSYKSLGEAVVELIGLVNNKRPIQRVFVSAGDDYSLIEAVARRVPIIANLTIAEMSDGDVGKKVVFTLPENISVIQLSPNLSQLSSTLEGEHALVVFKGHLNSDVIQELQSILTPTGRMLLMQAGNTSGISSCLDSPLMISRPALGLSVSQTSLLLSQELEHGINREIEPTAVTLVVKESSNQHLVNECVKSLQVLKISVDVVKLHETNQQSNQHTVILDVDGCILSNPSETQFDLLKKLVLSEENVLLWLTLGTNQGRTAEGGLSLGFLRVVRSENPGAKILSLDVDQEEPPHSIAQAMLRVLGAAAPRSSGHETEFWLHEGILHTNRLMPWACPSTSPKDNETVKLPPNIPLQSEFVNSELVFRENEEYMIDAEGDEICLQVEMTEYQSWSPNQRTKQPVIVVGHAIPNHCEDTVGQMVTLAAQNGYQAIVKAKKGACFECEGLDPAFLCATLPTVCKVLLCMSWLGRAHENDHILLLHMPLLFVQLAINFSKELNARITVVVETQEESDELYEASSSGIPTVAVEDLYTSHMLPVLEATSGEISLVISNRFSAAGQEAWRHISAAGRFLLCNGEIEGTLDPRPFSKGASFLPMGYESLCTRPEMAAEILQDGLEFLKRNKDIWTSHVPVYSIDQLPAQPINHQSNRSSDSNEKVNAAVQFRYGESSVKILPSNRRVQFYPDAAYLLIGGLGGLGSSLVRWMAEQGCRHFVFVSRSGATRPKAAQTVELAKKAGASVHVFRADAGNESDMRAIIARVMKERLIRGVVHAAMVLQDGLLQGMTAAQYQAAVTPKIRIAQILHSVLINAPLDFFVMTSSISGTIGTPGQTNYSAGNSFLDAFAVYRQSLGLPACSIALPMLLDVGVVAENQNVEDSLQRLGFYRIDEIEMLEGLEIAMSPNSPTHLVLGLDPSLLHRSAGTNRLFWHGDARLRGVQRDLDLLQDSLRASKPDGDVLGDGEELDHETLMARVGDRIVKKCASMLGRDTDEIKFSKGTVASYGLDSMIGSELQQWLFGEVGLTLSFHAFTAPEMTFEGLTRQAVESLGVGGAE
ncbi:hypothetical protein CBS147482_403 [Aspergillus niger]|nr:hypothetical protein CBS133816_344 [Aspergillus niger]KAI3027889.1 hypothetical protein CBS147482_403 [Aspergillus niger]KAI3035849.1 hypothetical protein CBS147345_63 [Aspergillus niger]